jgi:transposase-like protein
MAELKELMSQDRDFLKTLVHQVVQDVLEAEMEETLGASKGQRTPGRLGGSVTRLL